jgi:basic membrane protein A
VARVRLVALLLVLAAVAAACGRDPAPAGIQASRAPYSAGLAFDANGLGDLQFNDSAYKGLTEAREVFRDQLDITFKEPDNSGSNGDLLVDQLVADKVGLVIGVGFAFSESMPARAKAHPGTRFAVVDGFGCEQPNLRCIVFRENEGGFLIGVLAGLKTKTGTVGFIGGTQVSAVTKLDAGFRAGAAWAAKERKRPIKVLVDYAAPGQDVKGFIDRPKGRLLASKQIDEGADVIFQGAGVTGLGVIEQAAKEHAWVVGVDADQSLSASPAERQWILTSLLKRVDNAVKRSVSDYVQGRFQGGSQSFGLKEGGLDYAINVYNREHLGDIPETLDKLKPEIIAGRIKVPENPPGLKS